jgi:hypothetical protein
MNLHCVGNISYWSQMIRQGERTLYTNHTFQKQTYLSQFEILTSTGRLKLSIPSKKSTRKGLYSDVHIDYSFNWQKEMWRTIQNAYSKSPFFLFYGYKIEAELMKKETALINLNWSLFQAIVSCLKIPNVYQLDTTQSVYFDSIIPIKNELYPQVFDDRIPFEYDLSILDLLFNLGPETLDYLGRL